MTALRGTYPIVVTPFDEDGRLDTESIASLTDHMVGQGVQGLAILGVMGEADKLLEAERAEATRAFRKALPSDRHLIVGVGGSGTDIAVAMARSAQELGADALLVAPPRVQNDAVLFAYYERVAAAVDIPVILHDYPQSTGILMSPELIAKMHREIPGVRYIKLEDPPTGPKIARTHELAGTSLGVFGALGGMYALEELERGALGIMTGFVYPSLLVELQRLHDAGDHERAATLFYTMLPLIRFEFQPGLGVGLRKHILASQGAIRHATVRHPGGVPDPTTVRQLERIIDYMRRQGVDV